MTFHYFTAHQFFPFVVSSVLIACSVISFHLEKKMAGLALLFAGSLGFGYFIANLDHFLILWDEQYHALVAKNMLQEPFRPMLYVNPLVEYDYTNWTQNHIWLHKQPLFLWQIALSLKIFGINEMAVRAPGILLHAINAMMIYRIGKISSTEKTGYYGALFFAVAYYPLELIAGRYSTDHNDVSFLFYVTAGFWAWFEYRRSGKWVYLVLIGLFAGCAVLVKWLVGLLVYAVWTLALYFGEPGTRFRLRSWFPLLLSLCISFAVFLPWQLYILHVFPVEARHELMFNTRHFFEHVEGHGGDAWFHFRAIKEIYGPGDAVPFIYLAGLILLLKKVTDKVYRIAILSAVVVTYGFYTLAATKMASFCIIVAPFAFLGIGSLVDTSAEFLKSWSRKSWADVVFRSGVALLICFLLISLSRIENYHTGLNPADNCNRKCEFDQMKFISRLKEELKDGKYVVFNAKARFNGHIPVMFYTDYIAYDIVPTEKQTAGIRLQNYKIAILDNDSLPRYIMDDPDILKIRL